MIFRTGLNCKTCKKKYTWLQDEFSEVIMYFFDNKRKEIRFYNSVFLSELYDESVKIYQIRLKKVPSKRTSGHFDYLISCPLCRKFIIKYFDVPPDWKVFIGETEKLAVISNPCDKSWN